MGRQGRIAVVALLAAAAVLTATALASGSKHGDPRKGAAELVRSLRRTNTHCRKCASFGATHVVARNDALWLGVATARESGPERLRVYRWREDSWRMAADVTWHGWGSTQWPKVVSLTGSRDPDFAIQGCGAADTNCLSVVSDVGGRWHTVPFEYGYGKALVVNGVAQGQHVLTEVDACSCAGGPSTFLYERYQQGVFRPTSPPVRAPRCGPMWLDFAAGEGTVPTFQFDRVACEARWAMGVGTGAGYAGHVVGLFTQDALHPGRWRLLTLDDGTSLPAAPTLYDLPLSLLTRLGDPLGPALTPMTSAAKLIARLQRKYRFEWQQVNGIVRAENANWLVGVVPTRPGRAAVIYRWTGGRWKLAGRVTHVPDFFAGWGGWFVSVPAGKPRAVAFARAGSNDVPTRRSLSKEILSNAGGRWHVAVR